MLNWNAILLLVSKNAKFLFPDQIFLSHIAVYCYYQNNFWKCVVNIYSNISIPIVKPQQL